MRKMKTTRRDMKRIGQDRKSKYWLGANNCREELNSSIDKSNNKNINRGARLICRKIFYFEIRRKKQRNSKGKSEETIKEKIMTKEK